MKHQRGRPRTAHLRRMHLASHIDERAEEYRQPGRQRGHVKQAIHELYELMGHGKHGERPRNFDAFEKTTKKDLRIGRRLLREWQEHLCAIRRRYPRAF